MKKLISILLACMIALSLAACNKNDISKGVDDKETSYADVTLKVFSTAMINEKNDTKYTNEVLFEKKYPHVNIEYITKTTYNLDDTQVFMNKVVADIMAGRGADVLIIDDWALDEYEIPLDLHKIAKAGALADLNEFIDADEAFKRDNYLEPALKGCQLDGRQLFLPATINTPIFVSTENAMEQAKINTDSCKTATGLITEFKNYIENRPTTDTKAVVPKGYDNLISLMNFVDYENNAVAIDTPQARTFFETYKLLVDEKNKLETEWNDGTYGLQNSESTIEIAHKGYYVLKTMAILNGKEMPVLLPARNSNGQIQSEMSQAAAVSMASENKQIAYDYVKQISLNEEMQLLVKNSLEDITSYPFLTPYKPCHDKYIAGIKTSYELNLEYVGDMPIPIEPFPQEYFDQFNEIYSNIEVCTLPSAADKMVLDYLQPYFDDKETLDACLKKAQSVMEIYISE